MMDITKSRKEFEAWVITWWPQSKTMIAEKFDDGGYWNMPLQQYFEVWKASRESIEVELPKRQSIYASGYGDGYFVPNISGEGLDYDEVVETLRTAGIRIKGESE